MPDEDGRGAMEWDETCARASKSHLATCLTIFIQWHIDLKRWTLKTLAQETLMTFSSWIHNAK